MPGTIILAHSNMEFSNRFAETLENCGWEVSVVNSLSDIIKKIEASGRRYDLLGLPLEGSSIKDVNLLDRFMEERGLEETKLFAVINGSTRYSNAMLEKIKTLRPKDFISEDSTADEIMFRISNILYEEQSIRKNYRALLNTVVHCDHMQDFFDAESFTVSRDGMFIKTNRKLPPKTKLFLNFTLHPNGKNYATLGDILYSIDDRSPKPRISPQGSGIFFVDLTDEERDNIDRYIRGQA